MTTVATNKKRELTDETTAASTTRAGRLADRILLGAKNLATFAQTLTDDEWQLPVSAHDRRPIGVIIHHVASMYPAETNAAQAIGSGIAVLEITWDVIAEINAKHAQENPTVDRQETLELLRSNSKESADTIRQFSDDQLDTAAPFGLSFEAPVTAQFVIEDHALRHSWHHLAKIRKALGR